MSLEKELSTQLIRLDSEACVNICNEVWSAAIKEHDVNAEQIKSFKIQN